MTTFIGFNTIDQFKKFTLTDFDLIQRDLLNAFNIRQGQLPGRPGYGTTMYSFLFENQIEQLQLLVVRLGCRFSRCLMSLVLRRC